MDNPTNDPINWRRLALGLILVAMLVIGWFLMVIVGIRDAQQHTDTLHKLTILQMKEDGKFDTPR